MNLLTPHPQMTTFGSETSISSNSPKERAEDGHNDHLRSMYEHGQTLSKIDKMTIFNKLSLSVGKVCVFKSKVVTFRTFRARESTETGNHFQGGTMKVAVRGG
jgi:hypothetical protein